MLANKFNDQLIAPRVASRQGVTCSSPKLMTGGSPYGVTNDSLNLDVESGLGKAEHLFQIITIIATHKREEQ